MEISIYMIARKKSFASEYPYLQIEKLKKKFLAY